MEEYDILKKFMLSVSPLGEEELSAFTAIFQPVTYKRKTVLTTVGETERYLYFVLDGVQRSFHLDDTHPETTIVFTYPHSFSGVVDSFLTQTPSKYYFETLTASTMLRAPFHQLQALMDQHHSMERWVRVSISFALKGVLERQIELSSFSAEEKFKVVLKRSPHILQLIPHKYLASYMGIDPSTFSKLMASVRI
ncbi:MAG: Crp/Fnr family transcriptional regulator [Chitinophagaceae bacterium]|nr:Crp/Fnr family transcriptional regulator [Chitinophagaceae bacterium]